MSRVMMAALAWALIHFVWQGAAIALVAATAAAVLRRARPAIRYVVLCGALGAMLLAPAVTMLVLLFPRTAVPVQAVSATRMATRSSPVALFAGLPADPSFEASPWLEWVVGIWLSGVVILGVRSLGGWMWAQRLRRRGTAPPPPYVLRIALDLRERLGIRRAVRVLSTAIAEVPTTIGCLRPVLLVPVSALTALTPEQLELLIAHELAHIRRHDYLVNLMQTAVETVLFYHPAVWWISGMIRAERENCTDDLAVAACGDVVRYVKALAALEGLRVKRPGIAIAADGGSLVRRIRRLAGAGRAEREAPPAWLGALATAALVLATGLSSPSPRAEAPPAPPPAAAPPSKPFTPPPAPPAGRLAPKAPSRPLSASDGHAPDSPVSPPPPAAAGHTPDSAAPPPRPAAGPAPDSPPPPPPPPAAGPAPDSAASPTPSSQPPPPSATEPAPKPAAPRPPATSAESKPQGAAPPPPPPAEPPPPRKPKAPEGFLGELSASGYRKLSVDEIIALREHGVEPRYVKDMLQAGLGAPSVEQLINLHAHGVEPDFVASMVKSALVEDLDFSNVIRLRENDARGEDMGRIRSLGFGPFSTGDVIRLRQNAVVAETFEALKGAGLGRASAADAIAFRQNDVTADRIRDMKRQGFHDMSLEQILKLRRSGII